MKILDILEEPKGTTYSTLLRAMAERCNLFSLVIRNSRDADKAKSILTSLLPCARNTIQSDRWPGTMLIRSKATVHFYELNDQSIQILEQTKRLYGWISPQYPEDLAFYTPAGKCCLGSTAHEEDSYIIASVFSADDIRKKVPTLKTTVREIEDKERIYEPTMCRR